MDIVSVQYKMRRMKNGKRHGMGNEENGLEAMVPSLLGRV